MRLALMATIVAALGACATAADVGLPAPRPGQTSVDVPAWVETLIDSLAAEPVANPPLSVTRYVYRGDFVYFVPAHCCDIPSVLFSATGAVVCEPDGGLTGAGDGRCADFADERRSATLVWSDPRGATP